MLGNPAGSQFRIVSTWERRKKAPRLIREALHSDVWNSWTETRVDLGVAGMVEDIGDLANMESPEAPQRIEEAIDEILAAGKRPVSLGGDHSITYPILRAIGKHVPNLTIVHLDAHPDLYDNYGNNPNSHASPFARIMENKLAKRLVQIGVRTLNRASTRAGEKSLASRFTK